MFTCRQNHGAGHARADQYTVGHVVDMNAHRDPLGEPDPLESRIGIEEEFGTAGVVAIGDAASDALRMSAQSRAVAEQINPRLFCETTAGILVSSK